MAGSSSKESTRSGEIRLWREDDWWIATDVETGVTTRGKSRVDALENLDEAVALHKGEIGHESTDADLCELGIDPEATTTRDTDRPGFLE